MAVAFACGLFRARPLPSYDLILDIDGTLAKTALSDPDAEDVVRAGGIPHRLAYGALELLAALARREGVRIRWAATPLRSAQRVQGAPAAGRRRVQPPAGRPAGG
jgi:hypothetical protein